MTQRRTAVCVLGLLLLGAVEVFAWGLVPWVDVAVWMHGKRGAVDCGRVDSPRGDDEVRRAKWMAALSCVEEAQKQGKAFKATFRVSGVDDDFTNGFEADGSGRGVWVSYGTGMVWRRSTLLKIPCEGLFRMRVEEDNAGHRDSPRVECDSAILSNLDAERDYLFW